MLAENLKNNLDSRKMSIYKLSKITGIASTTIRDIISGKSQNPSYEKVAIIAQALDIPVAELTGREEIKLEGAYIEVAKIAQDRKIDPDKLIALIKLISEE